MFSQKQFLIFLTFFVISTSVQASPIGVRGFDGMSDEQFAVIGFFRTELYFGRDKPDGSVVSEDEWKAFLDAEVTSRFPAGFTVLDGSGQYRDKSGKIVKEPSKVLIFLYSKADRKTAGTKIDEIRTAYCKQFKQESVLRLDFRKAVEVSFDQ